MKTLNKAYCLEKMTPMVTCWQMKEWWNLIDLSKSFKNDRNKDSYPTRIFLTQLFFQWVLILETQGLRSTLSGWSRSKTFSWTSAWTNKTNYYNRTRYSNNSKSPSTARRTHVRSNRTSWICSTCWLIIKLKIKASRMKLIRIKWTGQEWEKAMLMG